MEWTHIVHTQIFTKMQNYKVEREVKNRTDLEKSIQKRKVHTGLQ